MKQKGTIDLRDNPGQTAFLFSVLMKQEKNKLQ